MNVYTEASNEELAEMMRWDYSSLPLDKILEVMAEALARLLLASQPKPGPGEKP